MMKRIFLYLLLPLMGSAQIMNLPATRAEKEVTDNVSTLTERTYDVYRGNLTQKRLATENTYVFNSAGNAVSLEQKYGNIRLYYQYTYADNRLQQVILTKETHHYVEVTIGTYKYDDNGRMLSYTSIPQQNNTATATPTQVYTFTKWDANGNAIEGTLTTPHSEALVYQEFDKQNRRTLLKMLTKADPPIEVRVTLRYDREGRVVERSIREGYTPPQILRYTYDKQGNNTGINDQKFEHTFNKQGNWLTRTIFLKGNIVGYVEREINY